MKKLSTYILITLLFFGSYSLTFAQPQPIQDALSNTKDSESELAEAKDEESPFTLPQRIKTFKNVLDLSISEAKDLKVKLLSIDLDDENIENWREETVDDLNDAIDYYEENKDYIETNEESLEESDVITKAQTFKKDWSETYSPLHEQVQNFILMNKSEEVAKIAQNRFEKIKKDLSIIKNAGIGETSQLEELLENAHILLEESKEENKEAMKLFLESIEPDEIVIESDTSTSTATSTDNIDNNSTTTENSTSTDVEVMINSTTTTSTLPENSTSTDNQENTSTTENSSSTASMMMINTESSTSTATTTPTATSTTVDGESLESIPDSLDLSIRDLVGSSLQNVRGSYHIFIEMSNFVRELLK